MVVLATTGLGLDSARMLDALLFELRCRRLMSNQGLMHSGVFFPP